MDDLRASALRRPNPSFMRTSLRAQTFIATLAATLLVALLLGAAQYWINGRTYERLEAAAAEQQMELVRNAVEQEYQGMDVVLRDWSAWDSTYAYATGTNPTWPDTETAGTTLSGIGLDLIVLAMPDGRILLTRSIDRASGEDVGFPELDAELAAESGLQPFLAAFESDALDTKRSGSISTSRGPMLAVSRPILTTEQLGPAAGTMLMGRILDDALVETLAARLDRTLTLLISEVAGNSPTSAGVSAEHPISVKSTDHGTTHGSFLISDVYGVPLATLDTELSRAFEQQARQTFNVLTGTTITAMTLFALLLVLSVDRTIVRSLRRLSVAIEEIADSGDLSLRVPTFATKELRTLGDAFNQMTSKLDVAVSERRRQEERFRTILANSSDAILVLSHHGQILFATGAVAHVWGMTAEELLGTSLSHHLQTESAAKLAEALNATNDIRDRPVAIELRPFGLDRVVEAVISLPLNSSVVDGVVLNARDITEQAELREEMRWQATHDMLTGLANRRLLFDVMRTAMARAPRAAALLYLDLDGFKDVNDSLGHLAGDRVLFEVARRLEKASRPEETVARLGGDEFVVFLPAADDDLVKARAAQITREVSRPMQMQGTVVSVRASIGVGLQGGRVADPEVLLREADHALYLDKGAAQSIHGTAGAASALGPRDGIVAIPGG